MYCRLSTPGSALRQPRGATGAGAVGAQACGKAAPKAALK
jgi:hypothetical protein